MRGFRPAVLPVGPGRGSGRPQPAGSVWGGGGALESGPAARARRGQGAGVQPGLRAAWVAVAAHGDRDRLRRHAVHRRLGDDGPDQEGLWHPPGDPPSGAGAQGRGRSHRRRPGPGHRQRGNDPRVDPPRRGRPRARPRAARRAAPQHREDSRPGARGHRGLAGHARPRRRAQRRARRAPAAGRRGRGQGDQGVPALAGQRQLHVPRLPRVRPGSGGQRHAAPRGRRLRPRHPSRLLQQAAKEAQPQGGGVRPSASDPAPDQGQLALAGAPPGLSGLHRGQEVRRGRDATRGAALPGPVHDRRLQGQPAIDPDHQQQGPGRRPARRLPPGQP